MAIDSKEDMKASVSDNKLIAQLLTNMIDTMVSLESDGGVILTGLKSGASQGASGAVANELWVDTADNSIKIGV